MLAVLFLIKQERQMNVTVIEEAEPDIEPPQIRAIGLIRG